MAKTGEDLIREVRDGNADALDALLDRYKRLVKAQASEYFIRGGDREDIIQEGMIGLYKAIRDYDLQERLSFDAFAKICVSRQIITAIKASARQKHNPLNNSVSLDMPVKSDDTHDRYLDVMTGGRAENPETLWIGRESLHDIENYLRGHLSELEYRVLTLHLEGRRHADIARIVGKNMKAVDNTLQRIRRKIGKITIAP